MRLLLDTHALLWYTLDDPKLSAVAKAAVLDPANEVRVSPATYWELAIKVSIGKLSVPNSFDDFLDTCRNQYGFLLLPVEPAHASQVACLPFPPSHRDPFDRMLVAQALVEKMSLVSADAAFDAYPVTRLW